MISDDILFFSGILGFLILFVVLSHLSARMGEGMRIKKYYLLFYIAVLILVMTIPAWWSVSYSGDKILLLLTIGNAVAIAASFKYWWWLKDELRNRGKQNG
jgi:uncharacterized membrane protein